MVSDTVRRSVPEQGQLVEVRRRQWVVTEVNRSSADGAAGTPTSEAEHLVTLVSVQDDALNEELQVVWELEPGAQVLQHGGLPDPIGFDPPEYQEALLSAVRWGAATNADNLTVQSPFRSGITIEDYQLDPLMRAIQMPRANLLLADDVGLGKTIEAGLVIQELILRHRARTVLIVCSASLQVKWRDEMREKFGLDFRIVDTTLLKELRRSRGIHVNPWSHFPRLITSIEWFKKDRPQRLFRDTLSSDMSYPRRYDLLVVDEAHNIAPAAAGNYALDSQRTQCIRAVTAHFEHRLFLTATPHNGYPESFTSLLELLDDQRFARGIPVDEEQLRTVMVRRFKDEIVDADGNPVFPPRELVAIEVEYSAEERRIHERLSEYTNLRLGTDSTNARLGTAFVLQLLKKRLFSSPEAFGLTLEQHRESMAARHGGEASRSGAAQEGILKRAILETEEDYAEDDGYEESLNAAVRTAASGETRLTDRENQLLDEMAEWVERSRGRSDSKAEALVGWLEAHLKPRGDWSDERVVIFTEYRATQNWLVDVLTRAGFGRNRLMMLYGGMDEDRRERIKAAFQASPEDSMVRILVATDAASEGIDLQNHCHLMVHMEVPWNPNKLEQRNGRIDRYGQRADRVLIYHFVGAGYQDRDFDVDNPGGIEGDLEFLFRVVKKVEQIRRDLGRVGPVIAKQVEEVMLGRRGRLDTASAERQAQRARRVLPVDREIRANVERLNRRLEQSRETLGVSPSAVEQVVRVGLEVAGLPALREAELSTPREGQDQGGSGHVFELPAFGGTWARSSEGLQHPHTGVRRPITFDESVASGRDDVVLVHLSHRLVDLCQRLLRAEAWAPANRRRLNGVTVRTAARDEVVEPVAIVHARLVILGEGGDRLHEEVVTAGIRVRGRYPRMSSGELNKIISVTEPAVVERDARQTLLLRWPNLKEPLIAALEAVERERERSLLRRLEQQCEQAVNDSEEVLLELKEAIERELRDPLNQQLELFTSDEKRQLDRNLDSLQRRVEAIPNEIDTSAEAIRQRYRNPVVRTFPVAVTLIEPGLGVV